MRGPPRIFFFPADDLFARVGKLQQKILALRGGGNLQADGQAVGGEAAGMEITGTPQTLNGRGVPEEQEFICGRSNSGFLFRVCNFRSRDGSGGRDDNVDRLEDSVDVRAHLLQNCVPPLMVLSWKYVRPS